MADNKELIQKADFALSDLTNKGLLNPTQSKKFIHKLLSYPTILKQVRQVVMPAPTMKINKIQFASRILKAASQTGTEPGGGAAGANARKLAVADRSAPTTSQIELNSKEIIAEVRLPYEVLEDNIEGAAFQDTVLTLIAERAALDLEDLVLLGDTTNGDPYLALMDGYLKRITQTADASNAAISKDLIKLAVKTMPDQYLRNRGSLKHFFSVDNITEMQDQYANRPTGLGDANLQGNLPLYVFGSPCEAAPRMPSANGLFCDPQNLIFGVQRAISMEFDKDIRSREYVIVLTCRVATQIEETDACIKYVNIA